jgi:hypothetical protein
MDMGGNDQGGEMPQGNGPSMDMGGNDQGGGMPQGGDPSMGMGGEMPQGQGAEGFEPQVQIEQDPNMSQAPIDSVENEEVIDVDDLTDSQEDTEKKVDALTSKFDKLFQMIGSFEEKIKQSDENINALKQEIEKRNPTQIEKMSMRSKGGYPFNVSPDEYWADKEATSNYSTEDDQNGVKQGQYVITAKDIAGETNWKEIADSLDDDDFMYNQTLNKILSL